MSTIFISIAAYRDPELVPTLEDCLAKAAHPDRLRFGICWQHGPEEERLPWADDPRFRILDVDWRESRGACWARAEIMKLADGETYFMQLDSHHRFAERWDEKAIAQLERTGSPKPVLTAYATPFNPEDPEAREDLPMQMNFDRFTDEAIILFRPGELAGWRERDRPARARFLSAHFLFTIGDFVREVPYDPELYFIGEEITLAVRAYTHGYDLFHPTEVIVWHEYTREYREHKHWTDHNHDKGVTVAWHERDRASLDRVRQFLREPHVGPFGLGTVRTFAEYEAFAGVSFRTRRAQEYTRRFEEPPNPPAPADWADRITAYALDLVVETNRLPADVTDYQFWYVGVHDEHGQEIHRLDLAGDEVAALLATGEPAVVIHREFESERVPATWTVWPVSVSRGWLDKIEGPVLSELGPVTLVTALLDLGRAAIGDAFGRSFEGHYLPLLERLLQVKAPMVVFVAPEHEPVVWRHRDPVNTRVFTLRPADLERLPWYGQVQAIRTREDWRAQAGWLADSPQAALPHYNPLVLSKMRLLAEVAASNPFGTTHAYWIDAGLTNTVHDGLLTDDALVPQLVEATGDFLWLAYPYRGGREIHGFPRSEVARYAGVGGVDRVVRGGFFGGRRDRIAEVASAYEALLAETLDAGLMGTEESLFTILAYRDPAWYNHYLLDGSGLMGPFFEALVRGTAEGRRSAPIIWDAGTDASTEPGVALDRPEDIERGLSSFMGVPMMQSRRSVIAFDDLWRHLDTTHERPARIIELGSGQGGLSVQLQVYAAAVGAAFITYDRYDATGRHAVFERFDIDSRVADVQHDFVAAEVAREVQKPGRTILICDGASKVDEVERFVPYLKSGDLVLAHDYARSGEAFERTLRDRFWNWCEITDAEIAGVIAAHELEDVLPESFGPAAWMCKVKRGDRVEPAPRAQGERGDLAVYVLTFNAPDQLAAWFDSVQRVEPGFLDAPTRVLLNNSTDRATDRAYDVLCARYGFEQVREGNLGILGGRLWCARHFARETDADFMVFFEDDMQFHAEPGVCRNGFPPRVEGLLEKAIAIVRNEPSLDYLKLSYSE
ncbi:MAG: WlaTC/HtrL family glycosyltransferase, partial [Vicinamibacterales bacterium]